MCALSCEMEVMRVLRRSADWGGNWTEGRAGLEGRGS